MRRRRERLLGQAQHHDRVLAAGEEQHRPLELGHHLAHDEDALGLESVQMRDPVRARLAHREIRDLSVSTLEPESITRRCRCSAASNRGASSLRHTTRSGNRGSAWLYSSAVPSIREACRPVAVATATGAAESHSYWPPACTYASTRRRRSPRRSWPRPSPSAPARRRSPRRSAVTNAGGRVRLAASRIGPRTGSAASAGQRRRVGAEHRCWAGSATAPARASATAPAARRRRARRRSAASHSATAPPSRRGPPRRTRGCRPAGRRSRPGRRRSAGRVVATPSSESTASAGRQRSSCSTISSWAACRRRPAARPGRAKPSSSRSVEQHLRRRGRRATGRSRRRWPGGCWRSCASTLPPLGSPR